MTNVLTEDPDERNMKTKRQYEHEGRDRSDAAKKV